MLAEDEPLGAEQLDLRRERVGNRHRCPVAPIGGVAAFGRLEMQDDEVADTLPLEVALPVELGGDGGVGSARWQHLEQPRYAGLHQMDARRSERLHEAAGQAKRDDIAVPHPAPLAADEAQPVRFRLRGSVEIGKQGRDGLVVRYMVRRIDITIADPVLQRDTPLPTRVARRCAGPRQLRRGAVRARHRHRAIVEKPVRPVLISGFERALDQQAPEARTVDEEVALDRPPVIECDAGDIAGLAIQTDIDNFPLDPLDTARFGAAAQKGSVERGVEMECIGHLEQMRRCARRAALHSPRVRGPLVERIMVERFGHPGRPRAQPVVMELKQAEPAPDRAEGVHVAMTGPRPAVEFDAELDRALSRGKKLILVDAECVVEQTDLRDRRLADADGADRVRSDERHRPARRQKAAQAGGRHPACRASADDN